MRNKIGIVLMILGAALVIGALSLFAYNQHIDSQAEEASEVVLPQLIDMIREQAETDAEEDSGDSPVVTTAPDGSVSLIPELPSDLPDPYAPVDVTMKEIELNGYAYIGYLSVPDLGLELPIMSEWDYKRLQKSPCRYTGTVKGEDLVLLAHNYNSHFGKLSKLVPGAPIYFTDVEGITTSYEVIAVNVIQPTAVEEVTSGEYALTLFTCTYSGRTRVVVYCDIVSVE